MHKRASAGDRRGGIPGGPSCSSSSRRGPGEDDRCLRISSARERGRLTRGGGSRRRVWRRFDHDSLVRLVPPCRSREVRRRLRRVGGRGQPDGAVLELGLLGDLADRRVRQVIRRHVLSLLVAPVKRDKDNASRQSRVDLDREADQAATAAQLGPLPRGQADLGRVVGVDLDKRRRLDPDQLGRLACAGQGVPVGIQPSGGQDQRELVVGGLARGPVRPCVEAGAAAGGREVPVDIEPLGPRMVDARAGPRRAP